jgi:uncharacterized membrane protein
MKKIDYNKYISYILRIGVGLSFILAIIGIFLSLNSNKTGKIYKYTSIYNFIYINYMKHLSLTSFVFIPIIVLILTPLLRVIFSIFMFKQEKNIQFVFITSFVLIILLISIFII